VRLITRITKHEDPYNPPGRAGHSAHPARHGPRRRQHYALWRRRCRRGIPDHVPNTAGGSNSVVRLSAGNLSTSRWGLRGSEDLGGGLKAIFTLENGFDLDTGNANQAGRLFGRQAFVGLQNQYGSLTLGRHQTVLYDFSLTYDPMAIATRYSVLMHDKWMSGRADNSLKLTGKLGAVYYGLFYSTGYDSKAGGEIPGDYKAGRNWSAAAGYDAGPLSARVVYDEVRGSTVATDDNRERRASIGASYNFGRGRLLPATAGITAISPPARCAPTCTGLARATR
jgi:predicted porin